MHSQQYIKYICDELKSRRNFFDTCILEKRQGNMD